MTSTLIAQAGDCVAQQNFGHGIAPSSWSPSRMGELFGDPPQARGVLGLERVRCDSASVAGTLTNLRGSSTVLVVPTRYPLDIGARGEQHRRCGTLLNGLNRRQLPLDLLTEGLQLAWALV